MDDCWLNWVRAFVSFSGTFGGAYAIRPYPNGQKTGTGGVGAYCIRPTNGYGRARALPHIYRYREGQADGGQPSRLAFFTINELQFKIHPIFAVSRDPLFTYINHIRE